MSLCRDLIWIGCLFLAMGVTTLNALTHSSVWRPAGFVDGPAGTAPAAAIDAPLHPGHDVTDDHEALPVSLARSQR